MDHDSHMVTMTIYYIYLSRTHTCSGIFFITEKNDLWDYIDHDSHMVSITIYFQTSRYTEPQWSVTEIYLSRTHKCSGMYSYN